MDSEINPSPAGPAIGRELTIMHGCPVGVIHFEWFILLFYTPPLHKTVESCPAIGWKLVSTNAFVEFFHAENRSTVPSPVKICRRSCVMPSTTRRNLTRCFGEIPNSMSLTKDFRRVLWRFLQDNGWYYTTSKCGLGLSVGSGHYCHSRTKSVRNKKTLKKGFDYFDTLEEVCGWLKSNEPTLLQSIESIDSSDEDEEPPQNNEEESEGPVDVGSGDEEPENKEEEEEEEGEAEEEKDGDQTDTQETEPFEKKDEEEEEDETQLPLFSDDDEDADEDGDEDEDDYGDMPEVVL